MYPYKPFIPISHHHTRNQRGDMFKILGLLHSLLSSLYTFICTHPLYFAILLLFSPFLLQLLFFFSPLLLSTFLLLLTIPLLKPHSQTNVTALDIFHINDNGNDVEWAACGENPLVLNASKCNQESKSLSIGGTPPYKVSESANPRSFETKTTTFNRREENPDAVFGQMNSSGCGEWNGNWACKIDNGGVDLLWEVWEEVEVEEEKEVQVSCAKTGKPSSKGLMNPFRFFSALRGMCCFHGLGGRGDKGKIKGKRSRR